MDERLDHLKGKCIIGIDLGTTKSGVSVWDEKLGRVVMCPDPDAEENDPDPFITPSVVAWDRLQGKWLVGRPAKALLQKHPTDVVYSIKRYIGRWFTDPAVRHGHQDVTYKLVSGGGKDALRDVLVDFGPGENSPDMQAAPDISAKILTKLREHAALYLGVEVDKVIYAVITVPAYFNVLQRRATIQAGQIAGLDVVDILNEPTASALAYCRKDLGPDEQNVLVYDLGGGTFDISLLEAKHDEVGYEFFTRVVDGNTRLGGDDIDKELVQWLTNQIEDKYGRFVREDDVTSRSQLRLAAERAKIDLTNSERDIFQINLPQLDLGSNSPFDASIKMTRSQLESCALEVILQAEVITSRAVTEVAGITWSDIHQVVLVGGQTRMSAIQNSVRQMFAKELTITEYPQHVVALGAGEYAHIISLGRERFHENALINVIALPLGIRLDDDTFKHLVEANVPVPVRSHPYSVTTTEDYQTEIHVELLQGPRSATYAHECVVLGSLDMKNILPAPARTVRYEVELDVRSDGTMTLIVTDRRTNLSETKDIIETRLAMAGQSPEKKIP